MASDLLPRCSCGRFVRTHNNQRRIGWYAYGEHGSEEGWVCPTCAETWAPSDGLGRGPEAGYCGFVDPARHPDPKPAETMPGVRQS